MLLWSPGRFDKIRKSAISRVRCAQNFNIRPMKYRIFSCLGNRRVIERSGLGKNAERGASLVEFSLVLPMLLLVVTGIIQFGYIFSSYVTLRNAAAVAARHAALTNPTPTQTEVENVAKGAILPMLKQANMDPPVVNMNTTVGGVAGAKKVDLSYNVPVIFPYKMFKGTFKIKASSVMR